MSAVAILSALEPLAAQPQGQPQKMEPPKWLDDEGKDLFMDIENDDAVHGDASCEAREKLLKKMAGKGEKDAADHRARVLLGLGLCEFRKEDYTLAKKRLDSCVSEMNVPSDEAMLQNQHMAHIGLIKQAATFMSKHEITQGTTALRRCREILDRNLKKILKMVHKQMGQQSQAPPLDLILEEVPGYGKTGQYLPMIMKQVPILKQDFSFAEVVDNALDSLDRKLAGIDSALKDNRLRLDTSKGKGKSGALLYVRALPSEPVVPGSRLAAAQELVSSGAVKALTEEAAGVEKGLTLIKKAKEGSGCKDGKGLDKTCKALLKVADVASNGFGETRLIVVKAGKKQQLDACTTNANVGILVATKDGATATVAGAAEPVKLPAGEPVVIDFCREAHIEAQEATPVLFAQAWHPEFAAVERTTELRARAKTFGLSEDDVKAAAKVVNDHAKKNWEKSAKQWREDSDGHAAMRQAFAGEIAAKLKQAEEAAEAKRKEYEEGDEDRKKSLEELQKKREAKQKKAEEVEEKRRIRAKQLEEEKAKRDPWLNFPDVVALENNIQELKEARRDANAKLEFDLSTQLTKDISAAERKYKKAVKKARKAYKKHGGPAPATEGQAGDDAKDDDEKDKEEPPAKEAAKENSELKALKKQLDDIKDKKAQAAEAENFKEAKKLKKEQKEVEEKIKKLEL